MTINVAVKCPDGIIMGTDSLVTLATDDGTVSSIIPYYSKLFSLGNFTHSDNNYAAGAMLNGAASIAGRTIEDMIVEFVEEYPKVQQSDSYSLQQLSTDLGNKIQTYVNTTSSGKNPLLEIIIGGYSRGKKPVVGGMARFTVFFGKINHTSYEYYIQKTVSSEYIMADNPRF
jgi:hypothetical protein